jgi:hypothetical protein
VAVGVDEAGHHDAVLAVEHLDARVPGQLRADRRDPRAVEEDVAARQDAELVVHREHDRAGDQRPGHGASVVRW